MTSTTRRDFLKQSSLAVVALGAADGRHLSAPIVGSTTPQTDSGFKDLCLTGLNAARGAGASYADVRVVSLRAQYVSVAETRVSEISDVESVGIAVRVLVDGSWGYAGSSAVTRDECHRLARRAASRARTNARGIGRRVELSPIEAYPDGRWMTPIRTDPFRVPMVEKVELLLQANSEALAVPRVQVATSAMYFVRSESTFASTDGSILEQTVYRACPSMVVAARITDASELKSRASSEIPAMGKGYEHVLDADLVGQARRWGEEAVEVAAARPVAPGRYDLILDAANLSVTVRETVGRPTGFARATGYEGISSGRSFLGAPEDAVGKLRLGPEFMNVIGDRTQRGGLSTVGWDDEGVPADSWAIVEDGVFVDYQTTREQAPLIADLTGSQRSHGCSFAGSWASVQSQHMPNVSLLPGQEDNSLDDLVAATDSGILIRGSGGYSIDQRGHNFRFAGEVAYEVRGGRIGVMLRDVAYQGNTIEFWNLLNMLGGEKSYSLGGVMDRDASLSRPAGVASHGCPAARFQQISVTNTGA